ncbi:PREDICTED: olfactory receptor 2G6-like [Chrysochloris asiatica]|uniref:Olfactory receptor n=1 Tax=Chrysochloris asiatica TaxID=185453 RepID=A0A9B0U9S9_CHRAS|nr:PREDICTED: olfactory receptor 2G6-like [Chrysochloris asiatica]
MVNSNISFFNGFVLLGFSGHPLLEMILFVIIVIFYLLTLLGNMAIIILASLDSRLHTPMYFFLSHLSFMDLCYTTSTVPQLLFNLKGPVKKITYVGCVGQLYVALAMGSTECILLAVMAIDRYAAICKPLHYAIIMHPRFCLQLAAMTWLTGLTNSLVQTVLITQVPLCGQNIIDHVFCEVPVLLKLSCVDTTANQMELFLVSAFLLLVPLSLILISYGFIAHAVWKISASEGRQKALGTCTSHLVVVFLFYGTATAMYLKPTPTTSQNQDKFMALFYGVVTPTLNPFIYTLRNKDMKGALRKMKGKSKEKG